MAEKMDIPALTTPVGRICFPHLAEPQEAMQPGGASKYSVILVFDKAAQATPEFKAMRASAAAAKNLKFGDRKVPNFKNPFRPGSDKQNDSGEQLAGFGVDDVFITASSTKRPGLFGQQVEAVDPDMFYPGCYGRASVRAFPYDKGGGKGVSFGLNMVQFIRDGEPLGGGANVNPHDAFSAAEPTSAGDGDDLDDLFGED